MSSRKKRAASGHAAALKRPSAGPRVRTGAVKQRQRLIDACISALHLYGPSQTTVQKVVSFATMSPGIVRFYFDSKAAMLVASLQFLSTEFEQRVLAPVAELKTTPVEALRLMVDLFLDPDIASPRKVSVWYAFWGEASSRQEYYDICGRQDERFARLVHELIGGLIAESRLTRLDVDGVALALIGVLEVLWQDIAFQAERDIDRVAAKRRCMAFLESVFPGRFAPGAAAGVEVRTRLGGGGVVANVGGTRVGRGRAGWTFDDAAVFARERETLFRGAWTVVGHESQLTHAGDFLTADTGVERVLVVRDPAGALTALRNSCPESPHTLQTARSGRFDGVIACKRHGLLFSLDGRPIANAGGIAGGGTGAAALIPLAVRCVGGLVFVGSMSNADPAPGNDVGVEGEWFDTAPAGELAMSRPPLEVAVAADWKLVVRQWLELAPGERGGGGVAGGDERSSWVWREAVADGAGWSPAHYRRLVQGPPGAVWRSHFLAPNQLIETRPDGMSVAQVLPVAAGRSVVRRLDYSAAAPGDCARATSYLAQRLGTHARRSTLAAAESIQRGVIQFAYDMAAGESIAPAVVWFESLLAARMA